MNEKFVEFISEGVNDPGIFKAVFLAGGPGSGKSFMAGRTGLPSLGLKPVNPDHAFEAALRAAGMDATPENIYSDKGQSMRMAAKLLTNKRMQLFIQGRLGMVIDGTGKDITKIERQAGLLQSLGYDIAMIFVNTDLDTALERNSKRSRTLPDNVVKRMWNDVQNNMGGFQRIFKQNMTIVDNNSNSNVDKNTLRAYKDMQHFVRSPVRNHKAREWITNAQKQKMREEAIKELETMNEKTSVPQDSDIAGKKGSQPAKYHKGLSKSTKSARDSQFKRQTKMRDDDPKAYKPAPGDKTAKTKPSKFTKYVDNMLKKEDALDEKCWDSHKQVGMKKKGKKMVPNCVPKNEESEKKDSLELPKIGKIRNVKKRVSKQRVKNKTFDKIEIEEITMSDKIKAKTVYKDKYKKFANMVLSKVRKDKLTHGGKLRHSAYFHAGELLRQYGLDQKMNSKILGDMIKEQIAEEYKYERGTPEGTRYMQAMTPGEPGETTKRNKNSSKYHYKVKTRINEEDGNECQEGHYYCRQRKACVAIPEGYKDRGDGFIVREDVLDIIADIKDYYKLDEMAQPAIDTPQYEVDEDDIRDMLDKADNLTIDDMLDLHMVTPEEVVEVEFEVDPHTNIQVTEALTPLGRIKRRQAARRNKTKLKIARIRALKRAGGNERIKLRATRGARNMMYGRLLRGRDRSSLPPAEKSRLEKMIKRFQPLIARIAVRMVPQMRKVELNRLKKRGSMKSQAAKKFKAGKAGSASKYKAKKFKIKKK